MEAIFTELEPTFVDFSSAERETTKIDYARQINRRAKEALFITSAIILVVLMISHHGIGITNFKCIPTEPIDSYGDFVDVIVVINSRVSRSVWVSIDFKIL